MLTPRRAHGLGRDQTRTPHESNHVTRKLPHRPADSKQASRSRSCAAADSGARNRPPNSSVSTSRATPTFTSTRVRWILLQVSGVITASVCCRASLHRCSTRCRRATTIEPVTCSRPYTSRTKPTSVCRLVGHAGAASGAIWPATLGRHSDKAAPSRPVGTSRCRWPARGGDRDARDPKPRRHQAVSASGVVILEDASRAGRPRQRTRVLVRGTLSGQPADPTRTLVDGRHSRLVRMMFTLPRPN